MGESSVFSRPPEDWSDDEIRVGLAEVARALEFYRSAGDTAMAETFHNIAVALADHRDARRALGRAVDDAVTPRAEIIEDESP